MIEDIQIYKSENEFILRGQITCEIIHRSESASDAIQFAIDSFSNEGGEVLLQRGEYPLDKTLSLTNNIVLKGKGRSTQLIVNQSVDQGIGIIAKNLKGAQITDLSLSPSETGNGHAGIVIDHSGDCQIHNVLSQGFADYGIKVSNNSFLCEILSCRLVDNGKANLLMKDLSEGGRGGNFLPNIVSHLTIYGGEIGIECHNALVVNISSCAIFQTKNKGIYIHSNSNSVLVTGCRTFQIESDAVVVKESHEINISSNIFCWHRGHGIILDGVKWGTISANNVIDSGVRCHEGHLKNGIELLNETCSVQVTGNAIFSWGDQVPMEKGIFEDEKCSLNLISGNNVNFHTEEAVLSKGQGTEAINNLAGGDKAWIGMDREGYPDFTRASIEAFIKEK